MSTFAELHDDLRAVARDLLGRAEGTAPDWSAIAGAGWLGLEVPEALGGAGATFAELAVVLEEMGRAATVGPFAGTAVTGVAALAEVEADELRDRLLAAVAAGERRVAVVAAPDADGAGAEPSFRLRTSPGGARLAGRARFVLDAPDADELLLLARDDVGPLLVRLDASVVTVEEEPLVDATRRFGTVVVDAEVATGSVLRFDGEPDAAMARITDRAALAVACDSFGLAAEMLDRTVAYASARRQFDRPIGSFQAVQHQCADVMVHLAIGRELLDAAIAAVASDAPEAGVAVARAKSYVCGTAVDAVGTAMQLHGGIGYTWESGVHVYLKRAVLNRALYGSPATHRRRVGTAIAGR